MRRLKRMTLAQYMNGQFTLLQNFDFLVRIVVACICGAVIGLERSKRFKEAGVRTHIIVSCAAAVFMIVSKYGFADLTGVDGLFFSGTRGADPARIAAQAVSGISFLGAGVIFKNGSTVKGLTTAAGIWATAGIGLAIGAGMYWIGLFTTVLIAVFQIAMHRFTFGADSYTTSRISLTAADTDEFRHILDAQLRDWNAQVMESSLSYTDSGALKVEITVKTSRAITFGDIQIFMDAHPEILSAGCVPLI